MSIKSQWIGKEGASFERVGLAFEALGFTKPCPDTGGEGAYALNIAAQYCADMTENQALAVVVWGLAQTREDIIGISGRITVSEIEAWAEYEVKDWYY